LRTSGADTTDNFGREDQSVAAEHRHVVGIRRDKRRRSRANIRSSQDDIAGHAVDAVNWEIMRVVGRSRAKVSGGLWNEVLRSPVGEHHAKLLVSEIRVENASGLRTIGGTRARDAAS
jgi:hypothetical protein